jgi:hypothetical protein
MPANQTLGFSIIEPTTEHHARFSAPMTNGAPFLILLLSWTGAQDRHVLVYTKEYQTRFPLTPIVLITTSPMDFLARSSRQKQKRLKPAVEYVNDLYKRNGSRTNGILMHAFSEGGSNKACELAQAYLHIYKDRLPVGALVLDSTPGQPQYRRLCKALAASFPKIPILKQKQGFLGLVSSGMDWISLGVAGMSLGVIWIFYNTILGYENNPITKTNRILLDPEYFHKSTPRCYLYSESDKLVAAKHVRMHALKAGYDGFPVTQQLFESPHVAHVLNNPTDYWGTVDFTWRKSNK